MKILVICQYYYPEQFKINDICEQLVKKGHDIHVLTGLPNYPEGKVLSEYKFFHNRKQIINGVEITRASLIGRGKTRLQLALNYISFAFIATIKALFFKKDFDLIYVFQLSPITMAIPAIILKKLTKKKVFLYCLDLWPKSIISANIKTNSFLYRTIFFMSRYIYQNADKIAVSSKMFIKYFDKVLNIKNNIIYMPMYAEPLFEDLEISRKADKYFNLLFAGNLGKMQDLETIINAAKCLRQYKNIHWHIVGNGSMMDRLHRLSIGMENITFHGSYPLEDMAAFYDLADAFLITLASDEEMSYALPNKVQSYMAVGKPIFGAVNGEPADVIKKAECGEAVSSGDFKGLADVILKYHNNHKMLATFGKNAKKYYAANFSSKIYFQNLINWLSNN